MNRPIRMLRHIAATAPLLLVGAPALALLLPGNAEQGAALHEQSCQGCHAERFGGDGSGIYTRDDRIVNTVEGLMGQVARCNSMIGLNLGSDQIDDLVTYLAEEHYGFDD